MKTRLTERLGLDHPIIQAPMAFAAGGRLARAVAEAGGLGLIGGGYGDIAWIGEQFNLAGEAGVGCGLITWKVMEHRHVLTQVLDHKPSAIFLSFGDPAPLAAEIKSANATLICQVQTFRDACRAMDTGADIIVAQGSEAGGHGQSRGTITLVPEVADELAKRNNPALLCAAGGIVDGRGLAAALTLGADGVVIGTRFWASTEALVHHRIRDNALTSTGDNTVRTKVVDIVRGYQWPDRYTGRVLHNHFVNRWHGCETDLKNDIEATSMTWTDAQQAGDPNVIAAFVGEGVGMLDQPAGAAEALKSIVDQATATLSRVS